jgi:hypothetical protein
MNAKSRYKNINKLKQMYQYHIKTIYRKLIFVRRKLKNRKTNYQKYIGRLKQYMIKFKLWIKNHKEIIRH